MNNCVFYSLSNTKDLYCNKHEVLLQPFVFLVQGLLHLPKIKITNIICDKIYQQKT
jgi:hypothetical protein